MSTTISTATATDTGSASRARIADDFDTFLTLLTTQLRSQSPTDPLDANQMTQQLVQFAQVEQQMQQNESLEQLVAMQGASQIVAAAPLIGQQVQVESDRLTLQGGNAELRIGGGDVARTAQVTVFDSGGRVLATRDVAVPREGANWRWDGRDQAGRQVADGAYRVAVTGAAEGQESRALPFSVVGRVTGAEQQAGEPQLRLGNLTVAMDRLRRLGG
jgi:flagellar basal-body rod modification protein FlgD